MVKLIKFKHLRSYRIRAAFKVWRERRTLGITKVVRLLWWLARENPITAYRYTPTLDVDLRHLRFVRVYGERGAVMAQVRSFNAGLKRVREGLEEKLIEARKVMGGL